MKAKSNFFIQVKENGIFDLMTLSQLNNRKSNHATWMLAIVIFLSGFTFSGVTEYAKADQVKSKTELVVSAKTRSRKITIDAFAYRSAPAEFFVSRFSQVIRSNNQLYKIQFDFVNQRYLTFRSDLNYNVFSSSTLDNDFSPSVG